MSSPEADEAQSRKRILVRLAIALAVVTLILAVLVVPPLVNVGRYKGRITQVLSASLGRPVRLSSVELHLLPRPAFVLTDLTVEEDPAYGAEPVLHANTVTAAIRWASLWRGLEISRISVGEASLNLVRTSSGHWNVESLLRSAAQPGTAGAGARSRRVAPLPYLEAAESRINVKSGAEKLPFSVINADISFWQAEPGEWRFRLRGQPARTDLSLNLADTGVVRLEADLHRAPELRQIPMHVDMEWNEAQLGQLTRLVVGSDAGWRGDLTGELHLDGTADNAKISARLRAAGVHRAEFAPAAPMDFDATCGLVYHFSSRAVDGLDCNSALGDGHVRLTGSLAGEGAAPHFAVELDRLPVAAALDALRTVRKAVAPGIEAAGTVSGRIAYARPQLPEPAKPAHLHRGRALKSRAPTPGPFSGGLTVQGFELTGQGLSQPVRLARVVLEPDAGNGAQNQAQFRGLTATAAIPAGSALPLSVTSRLSLTGYGVTVHGQASVARLRELALLAGLKENLDLSALQGQSVTLDVDAQGTWLAQENPPLDVASASAPADPSPDRLIGTLSFRDATWRADFLANPIEIAQATLHLDGNQGRWDPVVFAYGTVNGSASLTFPMRCDSLEPCLPEFQLNFAALDSGDLEKAILGAHEPGTLLSELIARMSPAHAPAWPELDGRVTADSLNLGPVTLEHPAATLHIRTGSAEITAFDGGVLGGQFHATGTIDGPGTAGNASDRPAYAFEGRFLHLSPTALGKLLGMRWTGGEIEGSGKIGLSGYTDKDFTASAAGNLHFEWRRGAVSEIQAGEGASESAEPETEIVPSALARFDQWTADAAIANGAITLQKNEVRRGARRDSVAARAVLGTPPELEFTPSKPAESAKKQTPPGP